MQTDNTKIIYNGNSIITIVNYPDKPQCIITKKLSKQYLSFPNIQTLEKEFEMTRFLDKVEGVRKVIELQSIDNESVLILEYIEGETLQNYIELVRVC